MKRWQRPGLGGLFVGMHRGLRRHATSARFWIGVIFLVTNIPLGYAFLGLAALLTSITGNKNWAIIGTIGYGITWIMLGLSVVLLGKDSVRLSKLVIRGKYKAWRRMRKMCRDN